MGKKKICPRIKVRITLARLAQGEALYYIWCLEKGHPTWKKVDRSGAVERVGSAITYDMLMENIRSGSYILYDGARQAGG